MTEADTPSISILLPTYNGERYLAEQLDSILTQTWTDFELLTVDDGSSDGSSALLAAYAQSDARVRLLPSSGNRGQKARLIELLGLAQGQWIAISDQDDVWAADKLQKLMASVGDAALAFGRSELIDSNGLPLNSTLLSALRSPRRSGDRLSLLFRPQVSGHAMLARREVMPQQVFESEEPFDWLISILAEFSRGIVYDHDAVAYHRLHGANSHNAHVLRFLNPLLSRPRDFKTWLRRKNKFRCRLVVAFEFLADSALLPFEHRQIFGDLASHCRRAWFECRPPMTAWRLRGRILAALRGLAGSREDYKIALHHVNLVTLGLLHPFTLIRVHKLVR